MLCKEDQAQSDADITRITGKDQIASLWQVHGNVIACVDRPTSRQVKADALLTMTPGLTLTIRTADCQNILLFDPTNNALALVHAGWKGMRQKILTRALEEMQKQCGTHPQDLVVAAGPSLCTMCAEFTDPAHEVPELSEFFSGRCIDLRAAADSELVSLGIPAANIERVQDCTRCQPETYWTYRGGDREKVIEGYGNVLAATLLR